MPTKNGRVTINFSERWLYELFVNDAKLWDRTESKHGERIIRQFFAGLKEQASLFENQQPPKKHGQEKPLVFGKPLHAPEPPLKRHANQRQAKS